MVFVSNQESLSIYSSRGSTIYLRRLEQGDYLKVLLEEALDLSFRLLNYQQKLLQREGLLVIDARSLFGYLG